MNKEEYPSDSDASDEDFCPANIDSEGSEPGSDDSNEGSEEDHKNVEKLKTPKQKNKRGRRKKKLASPVEKDEEDNDKNSEQELVSDDEVEKKRSNALWEDFLNDVSSTTKESKSNKEPKKTANTSKKTTPPPTVSETTKKNPSDKIKTTEVFEFAGEKVTVTKEAEVDNSFKANTSSISESKAPKHSSNIPRGPVKRPQGMLSSVLNSINKKNKLSVLEKTKMDWDSFKQNEGLSEELRTFNKGKEGFLEKRDFLERTDVRQFEIEKTLRQSKRSKR